MCFSASASFGASALLGTVGVVTLIKVSNPRHVAFAAIPLMFAVQQFSEGILWIGLSDPTHASWRHFPVYMFLIFAQVVWPVWVPFSTWLMEKQGWRKNVLSGLLVVGLLISSYLLYSMLAYTPSALITTGHIHYSLQFPFGHEWTRHSLYFMSTVLPLFISSINKMPVLGTAVVVSYAVTLFFFEDSVISVWCFFAAILSLIVLAIVYAHKKIEGKVGVF